MENKPVVKYIVTDEYKPLYALAKNHGPQRGPIKKPIRVDINTIRDLLKQYNPAKLFEVIPLKTKEDGTIIFSERIELTLENYTFSWYENSGQEIPVITGSKIINENNDTEAKEKADIPVGSISGSIDGLNEEAPDENYGEQMPSLDGEEILDPVLSTSQVYSDEVSLTKEDNSISENNVKALYTETGNTPEDSEEE